MIVDHVTYLTAPALASIAYTITDPPLTVTLPVFANIDPTLAVSYSIGFANGTSVDPAVISLVGTTLTI